MTFAKPLQSPHCENKLLGGGHTSFYLRCADSVLARRTSQIHPEIQNTHSVEADAQYWKAAPNFGKLPCSNDAFE